MEGTEHDNCEVTLILKTSSSAQADDPVHTGF